MELDNLFEVVNLKEFINQSSISESTKKRRLASIKKAYYYLTQNNLIAKDIKFFSNLNSIKIEKKSCGVLFVLRNLGRHRFDRPPKPRYSLHDPLIIRVGEVQPHGVLPATVGEERLPRHEGDILRYSTPEQLKRGYTLGKGNPEEHASLGAGMLVSCREAFLYCFNHCVPLPPVGGPYLFYMAIDIIIHEILVNHPLSEAAGMQICGLLGNDELFHNLLTGAYPAQPETR